MFQIRNILTLFASNNNNQRTCIRYFTRTTVLEGKFRKPDFRQRNQKRSIGPLGWFLLTIPAGTFCLGTWQIQRKHWKEGLIAKLRNRSKSEPVPLPEDLSELRHMDYRPVRVRGTFLHDKEMFMGPRTLIVDGDAASQSQLMSSSSRQSHGYQIITPFKLADRDDVILINRGWVPANCKHPALRKNGQIEGEVDVIGIVRKNQHRPNFTPKNQPAANQWFYKDLHEMSRVTGALPVLLDATTDFDVPQGPLGGQTRVTLRNEHLSYVFTWYSLSLATSYMWYKHFIKK